MPFILAGTSLRVGLVAGDSILVTADSPSVVTFVIGGAAIPGINKPGMDGRALYYGPLAAAAEVNIAAVVSTDYEVVRGLYAQVDPGVIVTLTAAEIATPQPGVLADTSATYKLNVAPYTRYRSNGVALVDIGTGGGGGGGANLSFTATPTNGVVVSDSGADATVTLADATNAGFMAPAQFTKLAGIEAGATADQTPAEIVAAVNSNLGGTGWQGGGGSIVVQEGDATVAAAAGTLDFAAADFDVTESPAGEANIALSAAIPRILAPATISVNTNLTAAAYGNRTVRVDTAGLVLTINDDATGGWTSDDALDIQAIGSGTFTLVQGSATLTTDSGASADSATAVGKRVQAQRSAANAWRTISPVIVAGGGGSSNVKAYRSVGSVAAPLTAGESADLMTLNIEPLTTNGDMVRPYFRFEMGAEASENLDVTLWCNGVQILTLTTGGANRAMWSHHRVFERVSDTSIRATPTFNHEYSNATGTAGQTYQTLTVPSLSAGCTLSVRTNRPATQTKTWNLVRLSAVVERA